MKDTYLNLKKCIKFLNNCQKEIIYLIVIGLIIAILGAVTPSINGNIINKILASNYKIVFILAIVGGCLQLLNTFLNLRLAKNYLTFRKKFVLNIKRKVFNKILNLNYAKTHENLTGTILNKLNNDTRSIANFLNNIKESLLIALSNIGVLIYIFYLNYIIGIYYLIASISTILIRYYGIRKSIYYHNQSLLLNDNNTSLVSEILKGNKDIKTLQLKDKFDLKTNNNFEKIEELEYKSSYYLEVSNKIARFMESVFYGLMVFLAIFLIKYKLLSTANFIIIFMYKTNVFNFSNKFATLITYLSQFNLASKRIFSVLDYEIENYGDKKLTNVKGSVTLENVSFGYDNNLILKDVNLKINAKSFVAIVGPSGIGKTTIFNLITKLYTPTAGKIYIDNALLNELDEESIRSNIALVTQQPYIFNLSIKENLSMIDEDFNNIKKVCKLVGLDKKIKSLEKGYDTVIGEDASILSGGEKQRLAIARALLSKTKILLLDEITSSLDSTSSEQIAQVLVKLKNKMTIIMITHDNKMALNADLIYTLKNKKLVLKK